MEQTYLCLYGSLMPLLMISFVKNKCWTSKQVLKHCICEERTTEQIILCVVAV